MPLKHSVAHPLFAAIAALLSLHATASDNPGAHQHGFAELQIAIEDNRADILLLSPAYNLLGFEHQPRTSGQHQQLQALNQWATTTPLLNTPENTCRITGASFQGDSSQDAGNGHSHHDHAHHDNGHSDLEITQSLICEGLTGHRTLTTPLTAQFPAFEQLKIQWVGTSGQGATRLERGQSQFDINH